jgi:hypothetical protein
VGALCGGFREVRERDRENVYTAGYRPFPEWDSPERSALFTELPPEFFRVAFFDAESSRTVLM